jgi:hypothetical protein
MGKTQISREGDRFEVPVDITRLSILVTMVLDDDEDQDGTDIKNVIDRRRTHETSLHSIKSPLLARFVRYLEYYKQEPSEFVM